MGELVCGVVGGCMLVTQPIMLDERKRLVQIIDTRRTAPQVRQDHGCDRAAARHPAGTRARAAARLRGRRCPRYRTRPAPVGSSAA